MSVNEGRLINRYTINLGTMVEGILHYYKIGLGTWSVERNVL